MLPHCHTHERRPCCWGDFLIPRTVTEALASPPMSLTLSWCGRKVAHFAMCLLCVLYISKEEMFSCIRVFVSSLDRNVPTTIAIYALCGKIARLQLFAQEEQTIALASVYADSQLRCEVIATCKAYDTDVDFLPGSRLYFAPSSATCVGQSVMCRLRVRTWRAQRPHNSLLFCF
jgi:hypothetical protein